MKKWLAGAAVIAAGVLVWRARAAAGLAIKLAGGGAVMALVMAPLCEGLSRRLALSRAAGIFAGYVLVLGGTAAGLFLLWPTLNRQILELFDVLPRLIENIADWLDGQRARWAWPEGLIETALPRLPIVDGTLSLAGTLIGAVTQLMLMLTLSVYFLRDRERLSLYLEWLVPLHCRGRVLRTLSAIRAELGAYIRCQVSISLIVAGLTALLLALIGVRASLALGLIAGAFNLIPYLGPIIGGAPAVIMASGGGLRAMLTAAAALFIVQQIDSLILSPRLLGTACALHPALVLLAISVGGSLLGVAGMLFSVPILLIFRSIARNWPIRCESI